MGGLAKKLIASAGGEEKLYVDDVFSTTLYTGNGSTQTINNGIDLAGEGGLVWIKNRGTTENHFLLDSARSNFDSVLQSNVTNAASAVSWIDVSATGFNFLGVSANNSGHTYTSWTFRKAPKFFDVVTYTGNGVAGRQIPHNLGVAPGMIIVKCTNDGSAVYSHWRTWHRSFAATEIINLNDTGAKYDVGTGFFTQAATSTSFFVSNNSSVNSNSLTYVAYLFAHDDSADGIIQCGSFTTDASGNATVNLGWEPQFLITKRTDNLSGWFILDTMRGWSNGGSIASANDTRLEAQSSAAEILDDARGHPTSTGFTMQNSASAQFIYLAIRRPNKPPKSGTEVFAASSVATLADYAVKKVALPFSPDVVFSRAMSTGTGDKTYINSRLAGQKPFDGTTSLLAEDINFAKLTSESNAVFTSGSPTNSIKYFHAFKRAVGFMDEVSYTGDGTTYRLINHNLKATPEFIINILGDSSAQAYHYYFGTGVNIDIGGSNGISYRAQGDYIYNEVTSSYFKFDRSYYNNSGVRYTTLLFASLTGVSKVGVYTGNGSTQIIDCGFSTGARYIFIQRADTYATVGNNVLFTTVFDFHRGIVSGDDKYFSYSTPMIVDTSNTTYYGEPPVVDAIDPHSSGFIINNQSTTLLNVTGGRYIFLAIA